jgi:hypothetical protein
MFARVIVFVTLFVVATSALAADPVRVEIIEYGIYAMEGRQIVQESDGVLTATAKVIHLETTSVIPAKRCMNFGFRFRVEGPKGSRLTFVTHLPVEVTPPGSARAISSYSRARVLGPGIYSQGYGLDFDWEVMPGQWTFEVFDGDRKLAEKSFLLDKDMPGPSNTDGQTCTQLPTS